MSVLVSGDNKVTFDRLSSVINLSSAEAIRSVVTTMAGGSALSLQMFHLIAKLNGVVRSDEAGI